eukprot:3397839-Prymnesium_polylepis.2
MPPGHITPDDESDTEDPQCDTSPASATKRQKVVPVPPPEKSVPGAKQSTIPRVDWAMLAIALMKQGSGTLGDGRSVSDSKNVKFMSMAVVQILCSENEDMKGSERFVSPTVNAVLARVYWLVNRELTSQSGSDSSFEFGWNGAREKPPWGNTQSAGTGIWFQKALLPLVLEKLDKLQDALDVLSCTG